MAIFFLSENAAVGDGQKAEPCTAGLLSQLCAERITPAIPIIFRAVIRIVNSTYLKTGVLIVVGSVVLLFEENMKMPAVFPDNLACYLLPIGKRHPYFRQMHSYCPSP